MEFVVPEDIRVLSLKSFPGMERWWLDEDSRRLICTFQDELKGHFTVTIETDKTFSYLPFSHIFQPIRPLNVNRVEGEMFFISEPYLSVERSKESNLYRTAADKRGVSARYTFSTIDFSLRLTVDLARTEFKVSTTRFLTLEEYRQKLREL
ncbi:MAG TPA: hypothetical protein EYP78_00340 [Candidatus Omnitrophica bacterium]|nr:hypothetical protein [Candidatus Omnitrophota bacterium]